MNNRPTQTILVVDDHKDTVELVSSILRRQNYDVVTAHNGLDGLRVADETHPQLILLDVMMPELDGYETCRRMRQTEHLKQIPIILFTAKSHPDEKWEGFEAGATDYLPKPTDADELVKRVRAILERQGSAPVTMSSNNYNTVPATAERSTGGTSVMHKADDSPQLIGVIGVRGGAGTTTAAINIAFTLALKEKQPCLLVDCDLNQGHIGMYLNRQTSKSINSLSGRDGMYLRRELTNQTIPLNDNLSVLLAQPNSSGTRQVLDPKQAHDLLYTLSQTNRHCVLDLGHGLNEFNQKLLEKVDQVVVCLRPERISVSSAREMISQLNNQVLFPGTPVKVAMFCIGQGLSLPREAIENFIGHKLSTIVNIEEKDMDTAVNSGKPFIIVAPQTEATIGIFRLVRELQISPTTTP